MFDTKNAAGLSLEQLAAEVNKVLKQKRDYESSFNILDSQLKNGMGVLKQLQDELANTQERIKNASNEASKKYQDRVNEIIEKEREQKRIASELDVREQQLRLKENNNAIRQDQLVELQNRLEESERVQSDKAKKIINFLENTKEILDSFK